MGPGKVEGAGPTADPLLKVSMTVALGYPLGDSSINLPLELSRRYGDATSTEQNLSELTGSPPIQANHRRRDPPRPAPWAAQALLEPPRTFRRGA